eukprot:352427_1
MMSESESVSEEAPVFQPPVQREVELIEVWDVPRWHPSDHVHDEPQGIHDWITMMSYNDCKVIWTHIYIAIAVFLSIFTLGAVLYWMARQPEPPIKSTSESDSSDESEFFISRPLLPLWVIFMQIVVMIIGGVTCIGCSILGYISYEYMSCNVKNKHQNQGN